MEDERLREVCTVGSHDGSFGMSVGGAFIIDGATVVARGDKFGIVASNGTTTVKSGNVTAVGSDANHASVGIMSIQTRRDRFPVKTSSKATNSARMVAKPDT